MLDVPPEDTVAQKSEAAQIREPGPLRESREHGHVKRRNHSCNREIDVDAPFETLTGKSAVEQVPSLPAEQLLEPMTVEADCNHHEVVGDSFALLAVLDGDDDLLLAGLDRRGSSGERAEATRLPESRFGPQREDAAIGSLEELSSMRLGQPRPLARIRVEAVLVVALAARVEDPAAGQHIDRRAFVRLLQETDHDRGRGLAASNHAHALGDLLVWRSVPQPVAVPVEHARMSVRLARRL